MKKSKSKNKTKVGFRPIVGATRYTIKNGNKTKTLDVIKARKENSV
jgi:ribosomal protein L28